MRQANAPFSLFHSQRAAGDLLRADELGLSLSLLAWSGRLSYKHNLSGEFSEVLNSQTPETGQLHLHFSRNALSFALGTSVLLVTTSTQHFLIFISNFLAPPSSLTTLHLTLKLVSAIRELLPVYQALYQS